MNLIAQNNPFASVVNSGMSMVAGNPLIMTEQASGPDYAAMI